MAKIEDAVRLRSNTATGEDPACGDGLMCGGGAVALFDSSSLSVVQGVEMRDNR